MNRHVSIRTRSRRGSSSVFLCVILSALVSICFALIWSTIEYTTDSRGDALMNLSGDSLLSEFDTDLHQKYGLFLIHTPDSDLTSHLRGYLTYTFGREDHVTLSGIHASGAGFTAADMEAMRSQILAYMKAGGALRLPGSSGSGNSEYGDSGTGSAANGSTSGGSGSSPIPDADAGHSLRHGPTIASLPSRQMPEQDLLSRAMSFGSRLSDLGGIFSDGTERFLLGSYVLGTFNSNTVNADPDHFFYREVEYILNGELTDQQNRKKTAGTLKMLRFSSNMAHIYADAEKRDTLAAAAELIAPGPAAPAMQAALAAAWAYAESANDAELLLRGHRVPLIKDDDSWAINLENVIEDTAGDHVILPDKDTGLTYSQYLRILLFLEDEDMITARIMDLIQINMRKNVDGDFLISECCWGITLSAGINGRNHSYEKLYQQKPQ